MAAKKISELDVATPAITDLKVVEPAAGVAKQIPAYKLPVYTVTTLPSAVTYIYSLIAVSNGTSNKRLAISDGTNWRFPDGNVVS